MKKTIAVSVVLTLAAISAAAQSNTQNSFNLMKSLAGTWEGKNQMGDLVGVSYRMTGGGSALMSEISTSKPGHNDDMISMIHLDNGRLLLTHYCSAGNQPRMAATVSPDGKSVTFDFVDGTNITGVQPGHMRRVIFTFIDDNHHTEEWHFATPGKELVQKFDLQRRS